METIRLTMAQALVQFLDHQYVEMDGVELLFGDGALDSVADMALELGTGARGLRSIMESFMRDVMFEAPDLKGRKRSVTVTRDLVEEKAPVVGRKAG